MCGHVSLKHAYRQSLSPVFCDCDTEVSQCAVRNRRLWENWLQSVSRLSVTSLPCPLAANAGATFPPLLLEAVSCFIAAQVSRSLHVPQCGGSGS